MKIYVTGNKGMLGKSLVEILQGKISGSDILTGIDICNKEQIKNDIEKFSPDIVIHCAAAIDIDLCEKEKGNCQKVNIDGTANIVDVCKKNNIKLIYISTPSVFDGKKDKPYTEDDNPCPVNYYGETKLEGEKLVKTLKNYLILRVNIFGITKDKKDFAEWLIDNMLKGKVEVYNDFYFNVVYTKDLSIIIQELIEKKITGILNVTTKEVQSKYDFAVLLANTFGYGTSSIWPVSQKFKTERGSNLSLDITKLESLGIKVPTIQESLRNFRDDIINRNINEN